MYFNGKNNTNIDSEFSKKFNFKRVFNKSMIPLIISIALFVVGILILVISGIRDRNINYFVSLNGDEYITLYKGDTYIEPGFSGFDSRQNNLSNQVVVDNQVNMNNTGEYVITYTLNNIIKYRYITVVERPIGATYIYLRGSMNIYLGLNDKYEEPGYEVVDTVDGSLKNKIKITNNLDTSKAGTYQIIYSVVNSTGVTTSAIRTIVVMDSDISLTLDNNSYTNRDVNIKVYVADNYFDYLILPNGEKITSKSYTYNVSSNGTYKFVVYNKKGNSKEQSIKVENINKTSPNGSCSGSYGNGKSTINVNANDDIGISKYQVNGVNYTYSPIVINSEIKTANVTIYDKAGNTKIVSCNLEKKSESPTNGSGNSGNNSNGGSNNVKSKNLEMHFIGCSGLYDDAILIRTDNKTIMIDGGTWSCRNSVTPYLKELGIKKIDAMIGSHLHYNHIQAQADILNNFSVGDIYYPDNIFTCNSYGSCDTNDQAYIASTLNAQGRVPTILGPGNKITVGEMNLYFLAPQNIITGKYSQNANSFIFILKYYNNSFMFTGDTGASQLIGTKLQPYADRLGISLDVDVLKYPHHGNENLYDNFLSYSKPEYVIVPNYNKSIFPYSENVQRLSRYGVKMYRQSDSGNGNILVTSDGNNIKVTMGVTASQYKR